jgi:ribonuclease R
MDRDDLLAALRRARDPRGLKTHEVAEALAADDKGRHRVRKLLAELADEGVIEKSEGARYRIVGWTPEPGARLPPRAPAEQRPAPKGSVAGQIRVHPAGYGFVQREDGEDDVFVANRNRGAALDGDRVAVTTWLGYKGTEGRVVEVLERGRAKLTGTLRSAGRSLYLEADDPRIHGHVAVEGAAAGAAVVAKVGQAIVAEITRYPTEPEAPLEARVLRVLGDPGDPRTEVAKVIACAEIPDEFPVEVVTAGDHAPTEVRVEDELDRVDLRDRAFLTIDPENARDFDDAVCVEDGPRPGVERLWVAVADVSHYVRPGTALDREARIRGVSVYLPNRAIPMLPHPLSSGICSLNPEVDRLAMVARLDVDGAGRVEEAQLQAAVIRSRARLDYAGVAAALGGDLRGARARYRDHLPQLRRLQALSRKLRSLRHERGSLDFDLPEAVVILDEDDPRRVRDVRKSRSLPEVKEAYRVVEDCMLAANEAVARFFRARGLDTLWRIHDAPSLERLEEFAAIAESFGIAFQAEEGRSPRKLRDFLETLRGRPMERALSYLLLRALKQAVYDVVNVGHFGLAAPEYLHFTSPIRRYPDLVTHRLLKHQLHAEGLPAGASRNGPSAAPPPPPREELARQAAESSANERRAMEAEREVVDMYRAFLMRDRVGEEYDGTVAGVSSYGIFVEIADPFVEGLVKAERLGDDRFEYDEHTVRLVGRRSGRSFALGDEVRVRIENVSVQRRKIDLALVEHAATAPRPAPSEGPRKHGRRPAERPKERRKPHDGAPQRRKRRR